LGTYSFYVYKGNNPDVIRDCLLERGNWEETDEEEAFLRGAFIWKPVHLIDTVRTFTISYFDEFDNEIETLQSL